MTNTKLEFYLDMDSVLVNLEKSVVKLLELDYDEFMKARKPNSWEMADSLGIDEAELWDKDKGIVCKQPASFYREMEAYPWSRELYDRCKELGEVNFLTTPIKSANCAAGKWLWILDFAGIDGVNKLWLGKDKFKMAAPHRILIDDKPKNVDQFNEHGGIGILFPCRGNSLYAFEDRPLEYVFGEIKRRTS